MRPDTAELSLETHPLLRRNLQVTSGGEHKAGVLGAWAVPSCFHTAPLLSFLGFRNCFQGVGIAKGVRPSEGGCQLAASFLYILNI